MKKAVSSTPSRAKARAAILHEIETEFERQAPGFKKLPAAKRKKHILKALREAQKEMAAKQLKGVA